MHWVKHPLPIRRRLEYAELAVRALSQSWIHIIDTETQGYRIVRHPWFGPMGRFSEAHSLLDTAIRGYVWGTEEDLKKWQEYIRKNADKNR
jgi:hypothetical protein